MPQPVEFWFHLSQYEYARFKGVRPAAAERSASRAFSAAALSATAESSAGGSMRSTEPRIVVAAGFAADVSFIALPAGTDNRTARPANSEEVNRLPTVDFSFPPSAISSFSEGLGASNSLAAGPLVVESALVRSQSASPIR